MEIEKAFFEEVSGKTFRTLKEARACPKAYVYRVWLSDGKIVGKRGVFAFGESICAIRLADAEIAKEYESTGIINR